MRTRLTLVLAMLIVSTTAFAQVTPFAHWDASQSSGSTLTDISGNGLHATIQGGASISGGKLQLTGAADSYASTPFHLDLLTGSFTFEAIAAFTGAGTATWGPVFGGSQNPYQAGEMLVIGKEAGAPDVYVRVAGLFGTRQYENTGAFDGQDHHIAVVYTAPDHRGYSSVKTYVDEQLLGEWGWAQGPPTFGPDSMLWLGGIGHATGERWIGSISEARVTAAALTPDQFIPEPATMSLLGLGGLALLRRRRNAD